MIVFPAKKKILPQKKSYTVDVSKLTLPQSEMLGMSDFLVIIFCRELFWKIVHRFDDLIRRLNPNIQRYLPQSYDDRGEWIDYIHCAICWLSSPLTPKWKIKFYQESIEETILSFKKDLEELDPKRGKYQSLMLETLMTLHYCDSTWGIRVYPFNWGKWFTTRLKNVADRYQIEYRRMDNLALLDALFWAINKENCRDIMDALVGRYTNKASYERTSFNKKTTITDKIKKALDFMQLVEPFALSNLKRRYRTLAKKYHPDISKQNAKMFQQLTENYEILVQYLKNK